MRIGIILCSAILAAFVGWVGRASSQQPDDNTPKVDQERIQALIDKLGSVDFKTRTQASKDLAKVGPAALELLRKASNSPDLEVRCRALALVEEIETNVLTEKMLAPKRLRLVLK